MKIKEYSKFPTDLKYESIDAFSAWLTANLKDIGIEKHTAVKARLLLEEILLRLHERFGEDAKIDVTLSGSLSGPYIKIEMPGEAFNPLSETNAQLGQWNSSLQTAIALNPKYTYSWGKNVLKLKIPKKKFNPVFLIFAALLVGVGLGILFHMILSDSAQLKVTDFFLTPAYESWLRMLNAISGPIIFFTVITTMLNTKQIDFQGGNSSNVIVRYFGFSFLVTGISVLCAYPLFFSEQPLHLSALTREKIWGFFDQMIPQNVVAPFLDSNTPQLILVAFVLGTALIALGSQVTQVKTILRQINMVGLKLAEWVSKLVPFFAGLFICLEIILGQTKILREIYLPLVNSVIVSLLMMIVAILYVSIRLHVSPLIVSKKVQKPFIIALKTGSLEASMDQTRHSCTHLLGVDKKYTETSLPQGLVLYMPVSAIGTLFFTMYAAKVYNVDVDLFWIAIAIIFAVVLFVATPPVPGANLLAYVVFFNWLGIPSKALMDAMIFDIVFGILAGASNQLLLQIEMILQARKIGILNTEQLKAPPKRKKQKTNN